MESLAPGGSRMTTAPAPGMVLAGVPGWRSAACRRLDGGSTNQTWMVSKRGRRAVLKIDARPRGRPYNTRRAEAKVQTRACAAGLANRVLYHDETVYLSEYVEGQVWTARDFADDGKLGELATALRQLHTLELTGRVLDGPGAARQYAARIGPPDAAEAARHVAIVEAMPAAQTLCCCHNDLVAENILLTPAVRFIDWEYACDNDPYFDLATLAGHHRLPADRAALLLDAYCGGAGNAEREKLGAYLRYYASLLWLWERGG
jgi:thiamine kinase-like enzyme